MRLYGLIGYPLQHSFSEKYFTEKFKRENINNSKYTLFPLKCIDELPYLLDTNPNLRGFNVTIPYKEKIIPFLDDIHHDAKIIGAVNTVKIDFIEGERVLTGYNTDIFGFSESLKKKLKYYHKNALILGTGGAAKAVAYVLKSLKIDFLFVSRRDELSFEMIRYSDITKSVITDNLLIINTTPVGTFPYVDYYPYLPYHNLTNKHLLFDLIYNPSETLFIKKAKLQNAQTINGFEMLYLQAEKSWEIYK